MLRAEFTPQFQRDSKRLKAKHVDLAGHQGAVTDAMEQAGPQTADHPVVGRGCRCEQEPPEPGRPLRRYAPHLASRN